MILIQIDYFYCFLKLLTGLLRSIILTKIFFLFDPIFDEIDDFYCFEKVTILFLKINYNLILGSNLFKGKLTK